MDHLNEFVRRAQAAQRAVDELGAGRPLTDYERGQRKTAALVNGCFDAARDARGQVDHVVPLDAAARQVLSVVAQLLDGSAKLHEGGCSEAHVVAGMARGILQAVLDRRA